MHLKKNLNLIMDGFNDEYYNYLVNIIIIFFIYFKLIFVFNSNKCKMELNLKLRQLKKNMVYVNQYSNKLEFMINKYKMHNKKFSRPRISEY